MTRKKFWLFGAVTAAAAVASGGQAAAQAQAQDTGDEIIVTATKRETALQDVAVAVTPVTAELIQNSGIKDLQDLTSVAPALQFNVSENETSATARLRGIGTQGSNPGLESAVGIFIDGVYRARNGVGLQDLGEVAQVEVLRGPQGTLFGRNTSAGLINVRSAGPDLNDFGASASASYGNYSATRIDGHVNIPIVEDQLAVRLFAASDSRDGFIDINRFGPNVALPAGPNNRGIGDSNTRDLWTVRGQAAFAPNDTFDARLIVDYTERDEQCCAAKIYNPVNLNGYPPLLSTNNTFTPGGIPQDPFQPTGSGLTTAGQANAVAALGGYGVAAQGGSGLQNVQQGGGYVGQRFGFANTNYDQMLEDKGVSLEMNWDVGKVTLTSITAYRDWLYQFGQDADFSQADLFFSTNDGFSGFGFEIFTQELRAAFDLGPVDTIVGLFYADEELNRGSNTSLGTQAGQYFGALTGGRVDGNSALCAAGAAGLGCRTFTPLTTALQAAGGAGQRDAYQQTSDSIALFSHSIWAVDDRTDITAGLRFTREEKDMTAAFASSLNAQPLFQQGLSAAAVSVGGAANAFDAYANCNTLIPAAGVGPVGALTSAQATGLVISGRGVYCIGQLRPELGTAPRVQSSEEEEFSGIVSLRRELSDNVSAYASYSRGYKGGGFNLDRNFDFTLVGGAYNTRFPAEFVDAFEIGLKNRLFDNALILNLAAFSNKYENYQLNTFNGVSFQVSTVPEVTALGYEVDAIWSTPVDGLDFQGGLAYTEAQYGDDTGWVAQSLNPLNPPLLNGLPAQAGEVPNGGARPVNFRLPGSRLTNAPLWTVTGAFSYERPFFSTGLTALAYIDARYVSSQVTGSNLEPTKIQPDYATVNGRLGLRTESERISLELWGRNITDEEVMQIAFDVPLQGNARGAFLGDPRTYGVTLRFDY